MLRVLSDSGQRDLLPYRTTAVAVDLGAGFYEPERDDVHRFCWMQECGELVFEPRPAPGYLELWVFSCFKDLSQELTVSSTSAQETLTLASGWCRMSVPVAADCRRLELAVNKIFPRRYYPDDQRTLSIRLRLGAFVHLDGQQHRHIRSQYENRVANWREMLDGTIDLESTPTVLGIDMYGVCNVKPPCVYCDWDTSKEMEGEKVDAPFTAETLADWGPIFTGADTLVNCSIGEPFMMKNLDELFDIYGDRGKALEMTTNGQILTDRNIEKLLDREIDLYISLDAATPETYARLRNDTLEKILENLRRLIAAKGGREGLPRVHLVFMPMQCNVHELEAFVDLCAELGVDRMVLRPLNFSDGIALKWEREGYVFDYPKELLPFDELIRVSARAAELCRQKGVPLSDQMDFGVAMDQIFEEEFERARGEGALDSPATGTDLVTEPAARPVEMEPEPEIDDQSLGDDRLPACTEPWTSLYILRRGICPCCYGGHPVAAMDEFESAWNSTVVQEIRSELAAGRFHRYCLRSPACPIVRKDNHSGTLPAGQAAFLRGRQFLQRVDRRLLGIPGRIYRPLKKAARQLSGR